MKRLIGGLLLLGFVAFLVAQQPVMIQQNGNNATVTGGGNLNVTDTQGTSPWVDNVTTWASGTLGAMANYGSNPGAVLVPGVNAFITNTPTVNAAQSGTWTVQPGNTANTTPWLVTVQQGGNAATVTAGNALKVDGSAVTQPVSGTVTANQGTNPWTDAGALSNNGAAAGANRIGTLPGIAQTSYNNGTAATQGRDVGLNVGTDGLLWTAQLPSIRPASYTASSKFAASSTTDNTCMPGNASNTVLVTELRVTGVQTTAGILNAEIIKRSAADTAGTPANITAVPDDSNYAAAVSQPVSYTSTGPSVGAAVGDIDNAEVGFMAAGTVAPNDIYIANWRQKPIVLRGTAQEICVNMGNAAVTGGTMTILWKWIETTTITP